MDEKTKYSLGFAAGWLESRAEYEAAEGHKTIAEMLKEAGDFLTKEASK